ncbi:hypothetical protein Ngar_c08470 [Candidatus Nitrososphaera gargensis Ga9.2]|uniref:Uncharacterized protein n=1 Tax=Nitrososphaera gargensis (strain Ga9.2) TaxID=1237085 RepID=K0IMC8_NITGG|nr:hypothetical protein [Candidatus Nitrososphaera gargensis]AFU57789.1 hypothetical protein Ngar_c08470 [Candidatus Nitrososphaera gargensis Ga9.2]
MGIEKKKPLKRDQALHDPTHGQFGEEPRPEPLPDGKVEQDSSNDNIKDRRREARKKSRSVYIFF